MNNAGNSTILVIDDGLFFSFAERLSRGFKRVFYHNSVHECFPRLNSALVGDGFSEVETVLDVWDGIAQADVIAFPDCTHPGLQRELRRQGKSVWGSGDGVYLEWERQAFMERIKALGLPTPDYHVCNGLSELRSYLRNEREQYIKVSRWRGNFETAHWINWRTSAPMLDEISIEFGGAQEEVVFLVFPDIEAVSELGYDGYNIGGKFPRISAAGVEAKDRGYFGSIIQWSDLPSELRDINEAIAPVLAESRYANFWSAEVRIDRDGTAWFTDPACRHASPAGECQLELWSNLPEIVWAGAHGECIDPISTAKYAAQALIEHKDDKTHWRRLVVPDDVKPWVKLYYPVKIANEVYDFPPLTHPMEQVGSVLGLGDTPSEAIEHLKENVAAITGQPIEIRVDSLVDAAVEIEAAAKAGVELVTEPMPQTAEIVE